MVGSRRISRGLLGAVFVIGILCLLCLGMISNQPRRLATVTVPSSQSFALIGNQRNSGHGASHLHYVSKRRVPNGSDPIHNRRAGKSTRPPVRA
ncbi:CLAVATA3/ESR (CLE)-related protein 25-like [Apium graveolens]|uniref:CLAVATA3/ESR (CLE)-related protein 25-like n=1 Tax=Apium graveolens TaxID=4045 RepID=UPI003D7BAF11